MKFKSKEQQAAVMAGYNQGGKPGVNTSGHKYKSKKKGNKYQKRVVVQKPNVDLEFRRRDLMAKEMFGTSFYKLPIEDQKYINNRVKQINNYQNRNAPDESEDRDYTPPPKRAQVDIAGTERWMKTDYLSTGGGFDYEWENHRWKNDPKVQVEVFRLVKEARMGPEDKRWNVNIGFVPKEELQSKDSFIQSDYLETKSFKTKKEAKTFARDYLKKLETKSYKSLKKMGYKFDKGDIDGDKVSNSKDCQPLNPKKQGFIHDAIAKSGRVYGYVKGEVVQGAKDFKKESQAQYERTRALDEEKELKQLEARRAQTLAVEQKNIPNAKRVTTQRKKVKQLRQEEEQILANVE